MPAITLGSAQDLPRPALTDVLNRAFSDYIVPLQITTDDLDSMIERDDILLDRSLVAYDAGNPVGVALVAARPGRGGTRTRLASMGVAPEGRRNGTGRLLLRRVIDAARTGGSRTLHLEVFVNNTPARTLYESAGFVPGRRLLGFSVPAAPIRARAGGDVALRPATSRELLPLFAACIAAEPSEAAPPWQLDAPALLRFGPPSALYIIVTDAGAVGYLILGQTRPSAGLVHLGILPTWRRRGLATAALAAALRLHSDVEELYVPQLLPEASALVPFLRSLGGVPDPEEQTEMELEIL